MHFTVWLVNASKMLDFCARPSAEPTDEAYLLQTSQVCSLIGEKVEAFRNYAASQGVQNQNFIFQMLSP